MIDNNTYVVDGIYNRPSGPTIQESGSTTNNQGGGITGGGASKPVYGGGGSGSSYYPAFGVVELVNDYIITDEEGNEQKVERKITAITPTSSIKLRYDAPVFIDIDENQQLVFSIKEDEEHRFVADFKIKEWDNKADRIHYHKGEDITSGTIYLERIPDLPDTKVIGLSQFIREMKNALKNIYTKDEVDSKVDTLYKQLNQQIEEVRKLVGSGISNTVWKESVPTYADIATTYPNPEDGWTVNVMDTDYTYRWTGTEWIVISANAIPLVNYEQSGLMSSQDKVTLDNITQFSRYFYYDADRDMVVCDKSVGSLRDFVAYLSAGDMPSIWDSLPLATAGDATATKGIASFSDTFFTVASGHVSLRSDLDFGLNEAQLAAYLTANNYAKKTDKVDAATTADTATLAGTANALTTARTLWGQSFNGTANVSGNISSTGNITPTTTNNFDIGSTTLRYRNIYGNITGNVTGNAATASKLITPRTISLTGDVTGSTSFDGSANANITVAVTKLNAKRYIWGQPFDGTADVIGDMTGVGIINSTIFMQGTNVGIGVAAPRTKLDVSGNIYATGDVVAYRTLDYDPSLDIPKASKTAYGWVKIGDNITVIDGVISANAGGLDEAALANYLTTNNYLNATNYTNYTVTKTGTGASGTWPISITGNAATATIAGSSDYLKVHDLRNSDYTPEQYGGQAITAWFKNTSTPSVDWWSGITVAGWTTGYARWQLASTSHPTISNSLWFRTGINTTWNAWQKVLTDANYTDVLNSKYVLKAGDTMSGNLILNDSAVTGSRMLKFTGYTDYAHIKFSAASSDNGYLEIATGDNGIEPIYIRQYNTSGTVVRTLTLLDAKGYSKFPGQILCNSTGTDTYDGAIQIRENNEGGVLNGNWNEGPRITFHWGNRNVCTFGMLADGNFHRHGNKIWDAANDGAGSGLDADLLDGAQSNKFYIDYRADIANGQIDTFVLRDSGSYSYNYTGASQQLTVFASKGGSCSAVEILSHYNNIHKIRTIIDNNRYSGWLDLITSSNYGNYVYSKTDADSRFVNVTGDTMSGVLTFDMSNPDPIIYIKQNGVYKGTFGWKSSQGVYMFNSYSQHYLGILDNGNPHYDNYILYCESNAGNFYSWSRATRNSYQVWDLSNTTTYNINTYYPVTITLATDQMTRNEIQVSLNSGTKPSWSTHAQGYSVRLVWEENGSGWGTIPAVRKIISATYSFAGQSPIGGITQLTNSSTCVLWLRGGGKYFYFSNGQRVKGGPYTTQQTISQQTFTTKNLTEAAQGWYDITTGWLSNENIITGPMDIAGEIRIRGDYNGAGAIYYFWNGRNKDANNWTSRISESASGRLCISGKLAVGATVVNDSYALSATSFYSSGNLTVNGVSTFSGTVNTNTIVCTTIYSSDWLRSRGANGWYNETYSGGIYMTDTEWVRVYNSKSFWVSNKIQSDTYFDRKIYTGASWANGPGAYNVAISNNSAQTPIIVAYRAGYSADVTGANRLFSFELLNTGSHVNWLFGGTVRFEFHSSGNFKATGNIVATGEVTAYSTSDMRLKKNIIDITTDEAINILSKIRPVTYEWNDKAFELNAEQRYKGRETGLIAQELLSVLPCAIKTVFTDYFSIDYTRLIPPIIKVVNKHEEEIKRLKARVEQLEKQLEHSNR